MNKKIFSLKIINIAAIFSLAIFFIIDRVLKIKVLNISEEISIFNDFFYFSLTKNYFISFSIPISGPILDLFIVLITSVLLFYIIFLILNKKDEKKETILLLFVFFGALSNVIDRLKFGFVIDYLEIKNFSAFNLADIMISFACFFLIVRNLKLEKNTKKD